MPQTTSITGKRTLVSLLVLGLATLAPASGSAAAPVKPVKAGPQDTAAEVARLKAEVAEQKQLILQLVRVEQEHYDLLLKLIQGRASAADLPAPGAAAGAPASPMPAAPEPAAPGLAPGADAAKRAPRTGVLRGKVAFPGGTFTDVYVYVENVKSPPAHGHTFEIAQRDKQFVPQVAVVQRGTKVVFPNYDSVFHNVFSPTARHPFDLGSYRAGDAAKSVEMTATGVVDVFCNMHSRMHASVLVVPSSLYGRVAPDGSFQLDGVPLGARKIVVWGPRSKTAEQTVEVGSAGADVSFTLEVQPEVPHNNKLGQPYGSYKD
jgi:plastocyanin